MERGPHVRPPRPGRARGAPAGPGDRARHPAAPAVHRGRPDPHAGGRLPGALPGAPRDGGGRRPRRARPTSWPAWCSPTSARPGAGTSTTPSRWRCSSGPSCWPASGERPRASCTRQPSPPRRPCYRHPERAASVLCAHCDRPICTDCMVAGAGRLAVPGVHLRGGQALAPRPGLHPHQPGPHRRGRLHQPDAGRAGHHRHQRGGVLPRGLRAPTTSVIDRYALWPDGVHLLAPVLPGLHGHVAARQLRAHLLQHDRAAHRRARRSRCCWARCASSPSTCWPGSGGAWAPTSSARTTSTASGPRAPSWACWAPTSWSGCAAGCRWRRWSILLVLNFAASASRATSTGGPTWAAS